MGWALVDHMRTDLVADALRMACTKRRPPAGVIFHSDRGCQYTSGDYTALAADLGVRLSLGRKGECWDNALAESLGGRFSPSARCYRVRDWCGRWAAGLLPASFTGRTGPMNNSLDHESH